MFERTPPTKREDKRKERRALPLCIARKNKQTGEGKKKESLLQQLQFGERSQNIPFGKEKRAFKHFIQQKKSRKSDKKREAPA